MKRNLLLIAFVHLVCFLFAAPSIHNEKVVAKAAAGITDGFITQWETTIDNQQILIPIHPNYAGSYNYSVNWGDGSSSTNQAGDATHTYASKGLYTVTIKGDFPAIQFHSSTSTDANDALLKSVIQWGDGTWMGMDAAFYGCVNLSVVPNSVGPIFAPDATLYCMFMGCKSFNGDLDKWDLTNVRETANMFAGDILFNGNISTWNVSNVTNMQNMFQSAKVFNGDISGWNVSKVQLMNAMFYGADAFNSNISNWNTSQATNMNNMFGGAITFNQDIGNWDVSKVEQMQDMFYNAVLFDQDLHKWNVSNVLNMAEMFNGAIAFNGDISTWNVSSVTSMQNMFYYAKKFNQNLANWNVQSVTNMKGMFQEAHLFDQNIQNWDVSAVTNMNSMFSEAFDFNQPLQNWEVSAVKDMGFMFHGDTLFNQALNSWNVGAVVDMSYMFKDAVSFNKSLVAWDVSKVTNMNSMFGDATHFDGDISAWDVSSVLDMNSMFANDVDFNADISNWNVSNVTKMVNMFSGTKSFNGAIGNWDVSKVTDMTSMFEDNPVFNQDISSWQTSSLNSMNGMFAEATAFNQNISGWDISHTTTLYSVFEGATGFNQNLGSWNISNVTDMSGMLNNTGLSAANYEATLSGWANQTASTNVQLGAMGLGFCDRTGHDVLVNTDGWIITGDRNRCLVAAVPDGAGIVYVDSTVSVSGDGSSWNKAMHFLSNATESAIVNNNIKEIHIAKGTYYPTGDKGLKFQDSCFNITRSDLRVLAGYPNGGGSRDANANPTFLSGDIGLTNDTSDNINHIMIISNVPETDSLIVDGFIFTKGVAVEEAGNVVNAVAAGLTLNNVFANTVISNCTFIDNYSYSCAGLAILGAQFTGNIDGVKLPNPQILHCQFIDNRNILSQSTTPIGGVFSCAGASPLISNCDFIGNQGAMGGATVNGFGAAPVYNNCRFLNNKALIAPVSLNLFMAKTVLVNCLISQNEVLKNDDVTGPTPMPGIYGNAFIGNLLYAQLSMVNCTVVNNTSANTSTPTEPIIFNVGESATSITNSILWGNVNSIIYDSANTVVSSQMAYSLIQGITSDASAHMLDGTGAPLIFTDSVNGNFSLLSVSPVIDAGLNDSLNVALAGLPISTVNGGVDLASNQRIANSVVDLGAFELAAGGLPVKSGDLTGQIDGTGEVILTWNTYAESYNKGFYIQVSSDGITFNDLGFVATQALNGISSNTLAYHYSAGRINGIKYYRFMQVDQSGHKTSSNIVRLVNAAASFKVLAYPNPVHNNLHVKIEGDPAAHSIIIISDFSGKVVRRVNVTQADTDIDVQGLAAGIYIVSYMDDKNKAVIKVVKH